MDRPSGATGFTPVNRPEGFIAKEPSFQSPQPDAENSAQNDDAEAAHANRSKRNPLVQEYLRPRRAGSHSSMFERAAISNGEELTSNKRRKTKIGTRSKTNAAQAKTGPSTRPKANPSGPKEKQAAQEVTDTAAVELTAKARSDSSVTTEPELTKVEGDSTTHDSGLTRTNSVQLSVLAPVTSMDRIAAGTNLGTTVYNGHPQLNSHVSHNHIRSTYTIPSDPVDDVMTDAPQTTDSETFEDEWFTIEDIDALPEFKEPVEASTTESIQSRGLSGEISMPKPSSGPAKSPLVVKPLVRPPFPKLVPDRSPIVGLSSALSMRTCFRVGEAINVGSRAIREGVQVFIELYARVRSSYREPRGVKQHFVFVDLFHDHQPYLSGIQQNWKGVELWDRDSSKFLEPSDSPRMCRCMGQMKKEDNMWKLTVFNIWEATMDDVEYVFGIIKDSYQPETISNGFEHSFANWRTFFTNII